MISINEFLVKKHQTNIRAKVENWLYKEYYGGEQDTIDHRRWDVDDDGGLIPLSDLSTFRTIGVKDIDVPDYIKISKFPESKSLSFDLSLFSFFTPDRLPKEISGNICYSGNFIKSNTLPEIQMICNEELYIGFSDEVHHLSDIDVNFKSDKRLIYFSRPALFPIDDLKKIKSNATELSILDSKAALEMYLEYNKILNKYYRQIQKIKDKEDWAEPENRQRVIELEKESSLKRTEYINQYVGLMKDLKVIRLKSRGKKYFKKDKNNIWILY